MKETIKAYNRHANKEFVKQINRYFSNPAATHSVLSLGETPLILRLCGAKGDRVVIPVSIINDKCIAKKKTKKYRHPHNLSKNLMRSLPNLIRTPVMVFKGSHPNTLAIICNATDRKNDFILVSCKLNTNGRNTRINNVVTSAYGKEKVQNYIKNHASDIIAYNSQFQIEKTGENSYDTLRLQLPLGRNIICFDNSISYSLQNVKGLDEKILDNIKENLAKRYPTPTGREIEENAMDDNKILHSEDDFDPMPPAPRLSEIMEGTDSYNAVDIQRDVILQMYETLKGMPPMTQAQHKELIAGCKSFLDTNNQIRNDFVGLLQENKRLQGELTEVKTELEETKKLFAEVTGKMNSLLQEGKVEEATEYAAELSQLEYITSTSLPERMNDISQRLADNAVSEQAIRTADYKFKDLVAMIYSSRVYEQNELPPEFIMKLEQSIEKLGYVSGEEHEALKLLYDEQTNTLMNMEMELFDATLKIDSLTEINENLTVENKELNVRVLELLEINENLHHVPQKEMTGLSPAKLQMDELDTSADVPNRNSLDKLISSIKDKLSKAPPEKQDKDRGL